MKKAYLFLQIVNISHNGRLMLSKGQILRIGYAPFALRLPIAIKFTRLVVEWDNLCLQSLLVDKAQAWLWVMNIKLRVFF